MALANGKNTQRQEHASFITRQEHGKNMPPSPDGDSVLLHLQMRRGVAASRRRGVQRGTAQQRDTRWRGWPGPARGVYYFSRRFRCVFATHAGFGTWRRTSGPGQVPAARGGQGEVFEHLGRTREDSGPARGSLAAAIWGQPPLPCVNASPFSKSYGRF